MLEYRQASFSLPQEKPAEAARRAGPAKRRSKLFFMLKPDPPVCEAMHLAAIRHARSCGSDEPHPAHLLHLSLLTIGAFAEPSYGLAERIGKAMESIEAAPIRVTLDCSALYGNGRHLVLASSMENADLLAFVRRLLLALTRHNLPRPAKSAFSPHVTIIYGYSAGDLMEVEREYAWLACDFSLVYSHNGEGCHEEMGRWRLDVAASPYPLPPEQLRLFN